MVKKYSKVNDNNRICTSKRCVIMEENVKTNRRVIVQCILSVLLVASNLTTTFAIEESEVHPKIVLGKVMSEKVGEQEIAQGLATRYYLDFKKRHLQYLPTIEQFAGQKGNPTLELNHQFGKKRVFESGTNRSVGVRFSGFLHFEKTGIYGFQVLSNDGVILYLDGKILLNDPQQHSDRLSNIGTVEISEVGYYPIVVEYFQRKGTAALKLFWQKPESNEMAIIPAAAYWHRTEN